MNRITADERKVLIENAITRMKDGEIVDLIDASYYAFDICIGDFRNVGMAMKNVWRDGMNWSWEGPGQIRMSGQILSPGQESQDICMDWS
jgi:hypothetical protein